MLNLNIHFTIVCITESWLKESNVNAYALTGYKHEHVCRNIRLVAVFLYL